MAVSEQRQARGTDRAVTRDDVRRVLGEVDEKHLERILALGPTLDQLERARDRAGNARGQDLVDVVKDVVAEAED